MRSKLATPLISNCFLYLGKNAWKVPNEYIEICPGTRHRDYITVENVPLAEEMIELVTSKYELGINGTPIHWNEYEQKTLY